MTGARREFADQLSAAGCDVRLSPYWAEVGCPNQKQGWKLHLSTIPVEAVALLGRVLPTLFDMGVSFKVASSLSLLEGLNSGRLGSTQVGKFMTLYPDEGDVLPMARKLAELTEGFVGPAIPTDKRLGEVLYARYGNFVAQTRVDRLGLAKRVLKWPDGSWTEDTYHVPFQAPSQVTDPFADWTFEAPGGGGVGATKSKLFGPGYLIVDVLHESVHGACFLALDMRTRDDVQPVVLKQARHFTMSDRFGRDARSRLEREFRMLRDVGSRIAVAEAIDLFTLDTSSYLALSYRESADFEATVNRLLDRKPWAEATKADRVTILRQLIDLATIVRELHSLGVVHRDLSNTNVRITSDGGLFVLDFEMAHRLDMAEPIIGLGTPGFSSPQQRAEMAPATEDDVYSFGCLALLALTGIDPRRLVGSVCARPDRLSTLTGPAPELADLYLPLCNSISEVPGERPGIEDLIDILRDARMRLEALPDVNGAGSGKDDATCSLPNLAEVIGAGISGVLHDVPQNSDGLWLTLPLGGGDQGVSEADLALQHCAHSGVAGPVYALSLAAQYGLADHVELGARLSRAAEWLTSGAKSDEADLPGLHFGRAGVALALDTMNKSSLAKAPKDAPILEWLTGPLDWHDVTHGAAGQGLAALAVAPELADRVSTYLCEVQEPDGAWAVPDGIGSVSGQKLTGFAHGTAGVVYYLCLAARMRSDVKARDAAARGLSWLEHQRLNATAQAEARWPYSDHVETPWRWWCHGGPGIALAYLAGYETFGEASFLQTASRALRIHHPRKLRYGNLSYCHGLAGLGEIYLEAFRVTGDPYWQSRVTAITETVLAMTRTGRHGVTWLAEDPVLPTADLGLGSSGVLHFLLRCHVGPETIGLPLCPSPTDVARAER